MTKKVLVTGGAGFVGSHLCEELVKRGNYEVYSLDNYFTGSTDNHVPHVTYLKGNASEIATLVNFKPDYIYHLGEYSRVEQSFEDFDKVWDFNKNGIIEVLKFAKKHDSKLIYAGSSTKYGDEGEGRNQSPYAWTKASNTELVNNFAKWFGLNYAITYFYNVYGGREIKSGKYATLIALFKEKVKNGEELTVVSPGTQKRNFTHIDDIVNGLILVGEKGQGDEHGIGNEKAYTILEVAKLFQGHVKMLPERAGNRLSASVMTDKTKSLGWKCTHNLKDHLNDFLKTIKK